MSAALDAVLAVAATDPALCPCGRYFDEHYSGGCQDRYGFTRPGHPDHPSATATLTYAGRVRHVTVKGERVLYAAPGDVVLDSTLTPTACDAMWDGGPNFEVLTARGFRFQVAAADLRVSA